MTIEPRYIIVKASEPVGPSSRGMVKFLRHEGHKHYWTLQRYEAMEYTKFDVAEALAKANGGQVQAAESK